jgi:NitT/TauT family transport system ATP-binding protein
MTANPPFVQISCISKTFDGNEAHDAIHVIDNVSLDIDTGEFIVFLGPSGCGKTTLMRVVGGLEQANSGTVDLAGVRVTGPDRRKGMVFQAYTSFPWLTVYENILFGTKYRSDISTTEKAEISRHYLELVGLGEYANFYVNRISGGMRQRVAIARSLAAGPDILLMDEPFGALDAQTREFLQVQLLEISRQEKKVVIFVTHDVEEAVFLADRIVMYSARPAKIVEILSVKDTIPGQRSIETKETEEFFRLRNHVRNIMLSETNAMGLIGAPTGGGV